MFEHKMLEGKNNRVIIDDIEPDVLYEVLRFIYTGRTHAIERMADLLLPVADKVCRIKNKKVYFFGIFYIKYEKLNSSMRWIA